MLGPALTRSQKNKLPAKLAEKGKSGCLITFAIWLFRRIFANSKGLYRHLKARGNATLIWVLNDDADFDEVQSNFGSSLDGIMTDYPTKLSNWTQNYTNSHRGEGTMQVNE